MFWSLTLLTVVQAYRTTMSI